MQAINIAVVQTILHWEDVDANLQHFESKIEGIKDVKIPKPGICSIQTKKNVSFASLQKVLTLLGVYQCDIIDQHSSIKFAEN
jgi:hypothetical protein